MVRQCHALVALCPPSSNIESMLLATARRYYSVQLDKATEAEYYIPQVQGILNGTIDWSPDNWISASTLELSHHFTIYFTESRRFATATITITFDASGRASVTDVWGRGPSFETHEPFGFEDDGRWITILELIFYLVQLFRLFSSLLELWDCVRMTELLLPLQILTASLELQLREIEYFHEKASEVYDPRDPKTTEAFSFPDLLDLRNHMVTTVNDIEDEIEVLTEKLRELKLRMIANKHEKMSKRVYGDFKKEMEELQLKLVAKYTAMRKERHVAEIAAILQLAVMWKNAWSWVRVQSI